MIGYLKAKKILKKSRINISLENVSFLDSLKRISAENIYSKVNYPAGDNTAFDGYAINSKDTIFLNKKKSKLFKIIKTIAAGDDPKIRNVKKFQTAEVMTGALIPKPFDTVIPIEQIKFFTNSI